MSKETAEQTMNQNETNGKAKQAAIEILKKYGIVFVLILMIIGISILRPNFLTPNNIFNVLTQSAIFGIMALGMTLVITSKGIDLSVGSVLALTGVVAASLGQSASATSKFFPGLGEMPLIVPILAAVLLGALIGAINGGLLSYTGIPPFIATLGMMTIARGFALIYTGGSPISSLTPAFTRLGGRLGVVPIPVIIYGIMIVITWILLNNTQFGKNVYAIGGNIKAAEVSGVNVKKNLILIYAYCGMLAGVAAIVFAGRVGSVHPGAATGYELTAIAATTIGGTSHAGGIGTVWGAVVGALVLSVLRNGLTLLGVHAYWQQIIEGMIIVVAVIIDMRKNARKK
ncbi:ABC transporter permease [Anoxynatronum sibiricum]|uniref:ABC transporter permease n=1 Tax=Anoxynatronum sibiricum TaxID=210623 RepID=A0ABU9VXQ9_9CLOT